MAADGDGAAPQRRFECIVIDWAAVAEGDVGELRGLIEALCGGGMDLALVTSGDVEAIDRRLGARPAGPGRLLLCSDRSVLQVDPDGLRPVYRGDAGTQGETPEAVRWLMADLWARGVAPDSVIAVGSCHVGDGPQDVDNGPHDVDNGPHQDGDRPRAALPEILADQLHRRGDVPVTRPAPEWGVVIDGADPRLTRVYESLLTLADGLLGTRGTPVTGDGTTTPGVFMAGVYRGQGPDSQLAPLPMWATLGLPEQARPARQTLDLRAGILLDEGGVTSLRFSSFTRPGTVVMRASGPPELIPEPSRRTVSGEVTAVISDLRAGGGGLDRLGVYGTDQGAVEARFAQAERMGFERLLREHRAEWARRWRHADVVIDGDLALQQAIRFAVFHLMGSVGRHGEAAVGARGLSGPAYLGHVFWDSDVFVLPFLAATEPAAARAMLEYRVRRLPAARAAARAQGFAGARFPWESAADGVDVTPNLARLPTGEDLLIRTGELEEHIVADVAWAVACYLDWTGDAAFAAGAGGTLLAETARYWASRIRLDDDGRGHIERVMGPDEYHQPVDDNAFTNVMARWNLRRAAGLAGLAGLAGAPRNAASPDGRPGAVVPADVAPADVAPAHVVPPDEAAYWLTLANAIVDGYNARTGLYEQFAGFFDLEPLELADLLPPGRGRPIAADVLLGAYRVGRAQVVKQADVLMLHHLIPDEVQPGSLAANLDFYEPRTAHGSSLSPAIHASLMAQAGRTDQALRWLKVAARMDLDDLSGTTAGGLHLATMGGLWQALAFGFAGVRVRAGRLTVRPRLPSLWRGLELNLRFRGAPVRLRLEGGTVRLESAAADIRRIDDHWEVVLR